MSKDSLKVIDNRTDETYDLPITYGTYFEDGAHVRSADLNQIKGSDNDFGLLGYDPSYVNTASCSSAVTYIDGAKGILRYRGYPIEQLVAESSYLEVAYLLVYGELPSRDQLDGFSEQVNSQTVISDDILSFIDGFPKGSHTMGMLVGALGGLSVFYDDEGDFGTEEAQTSSYLSVGWQYCDHRCCGASPQCGSALCVFRSRVGVLRQFFEYAVWDRGRGLSG